MAGDPKDTDSKPLLEKPADDVMQKLGSAIQDEARCCKEAIRGFFQEAKNPTFALNAELAFRNACCMVILGLPFLIPKGHVKALDDFKETGLYTLGCVFFCVFNLGKSFGETLCNVVHGIKGALIAVFHIWALWSIFPHSVTDDSPPYVFWIGVADGVVFIGVILLLNFNMSTKIFSICSHVGWWMLFLKPGDNGFHWPGSDEWDPTEDAAFSCLVTTAIGAVLALLSALLPYPLLARDMADEVAKDLARNAPQTWRLMVEYLSNTSRNAYKQDQVYRNMVRYDTKCKGLSALLDSSWWESFGMVKSRLIRRKLRRLDQAMAQGSECIHAIWGTASDLEWDDTHNTMMARIAPTMNQCVDHAEKLMNECYRASIAGQLSDVQIQDLRILVASVKESEVALAKVVHEFRQSVGLKASESGKENHKLLEKWVLPHVLAFNLSCFLHSIVSFAEDLDKGNVDMNSLPLADLVGSWSDLVKGVLEPSNMNFVKRAMICINLSFVIGFFGYEPLIKPYFSGIAATSSLLLSKFTGSAIVKNLGRVQGVVLGMVAGQIIKSFFHTCDWYNVVLLGLVAFLWSFGLLFVWHNGSPQTSFVGSLAACFGLSMILSGSCTPIGKEQVIDKEGTYDSIVTNIIACCIIILVDVCIGPGRADEHAVDSMIKVFDHIDQTLESHFDPSHKEALARASTLQATTDCAQEMGDHANNEPRIWKTAWKADVYNYTITRVHHMRFSLRSLESCMSEGFVKGGARNKFLQDLLGTRAFPDLGKFLRKKLGVVKKLCTIFEHDTTARLPVLADPDVSTEMITEAHEHINRLIQELTDEKKLFVEESKPSPCMREDEFAQLCMTYGSLEGIMRDLRLIQHSILREC